VKPEPFELVEDTPRKRRKKQDEPLMGEDEMKKAILRWLCDWLQMMTAVLFALILFGLLCYAMFLHMVNRATEGIRNEPHKMQSK
jgi:hypothetical protein